MQTLLSFNSFVLCSSMASPLRCLLKAFHPVCAKVNVDLGLAMSKMMPMMELASSGMMSIPVEKIDYRTKTVCTT